MSYDEALLRARMVLGLVDYENKLVYGSTLDAFAKELMTHYNQKLSDKTDNATTQGIRQELDNKLSEEDISSILQAIK